MTQSEPTDVRLLVIVSGDYGELGGAMYFLRGLGSRACATVLVPQSLRHALSSSGEMEVHAYASLADIEARLAAVRPQAVMLFSGYLLAIGRRYSLLNVLSLLRTLRRSGVPVLTSDPFIGLIDGPAALDFSYVLGTRGTALGRRVRSWHLALRLALLQRQLRGCWHIYPSPIERLHGPRDGGRAISYSNNPYPLKRAPDSTSGEASGAEPASWIFVLSQIDWQVQVRTDGAGFVQSLAARLAEVASMGKRAVLIAPAGLLDALRDAASGEPRIVLVFNEGYAGFMQRLMEAEHAFFWNYYSFSVIHRVLAHLPVMFFDEGHMVHILPSLHDAGVRLFYDGWRPPLLDLSSALEAADIEQRAAEARRQFKRIAQGLGECETPLTVLRRVLSADQGNVLDPQA